MDIYAIQDICKRFSGSEKYMRTLGGFSDYHKVVTKSSTTEAAKSNTGHISSAVECNKNKSNKLDVFTSNMTARKLST